MDRSALPLWAHHWNGHARLVQTQEELDALPPGYSLDGIPDPEAMGFPWRNVHQQQGGPFAPYLHYQDPLYFMQYRPGGSMGVCAVRGCVYTYRWRSPGEKFNLEDRGEDQALLDSGAIVASPSLADRRYMHPDTGCFFRDEIALARYARCYEADDTTGVGFTPTPAPPPTTAFRPTRNKGGRHKRSENEAKLQDFLNSVETVVKLYRSKNDGIDPQIQEIPPLWPPPGISLRTLNRWWKDAVYLTAFSTLADFVEAIPRERSCPRLPAIAIGQKLSRLVSDGFFSHPPPSSRQQFLTRQK